MGYLPSQFGVDIGTYEFCVSKFASGTVEDLAQTFVDMLKDLKK